jgi:hypothetical protein
LDGKLEGKRPVIRPRCRWEYNIGMDLKERGGKMWSGFIWLRMETGGGLL